MEKIIKNKKFQLIKLVFKSSSMRLPSIWLETDELTMHTPYIRVLSADAAPDLWW